MRTVYKLWKKAGLWRTTVIVALIFSGLAVLYPIVTRPPLYQSPASTSQAPASTYVAPLVVAPVPQEPKFGETITGKIYFGGRFIPLPPGDWTLVAHIPTTDNHGIKIDSVALAGVNQSILTGMITLIGNDISTPIKNGVRSDGNCDRTDLNYTNVTSNADFGPQECQIIDYVSATAMEHSTNDALLRAAAGEIKNKQYQLPTTLIGPSFRFSENGNLIIARYLFSPEKEGIAAPKEPNWAESEWNKYMIAKYPEKQAYLNRLIVWTNKFLPLMHKAFEGKMEDKIPAEYSSLMP